MRNSFRAHCSPHPTDDFGSTFEEVVNLLQQLEECDDMSGDPLSKLKTMDSAVAALVRQPRVRFELQLQDVLPRCVTVAKSSRIKLTDLVQDRPSAGRDPGQRRTGWLIQAHPASRRRPG